MSKASHKDDLEAVVDPVERALQREIRILTARVAKIEAAMQENPVEDLVKLHAEAEAWFKDNQAKPAQEKIAALDAFQDREKHIFRRIAVLKKRDLTALRDQQLNLEWQLDQLRETSEWHAWRTRKGRR
ncbi:MAG TPA: hypothetical protein PKY05_14445 [Fibrobacteria bacterium]|nr:hypothetical protein [Fibrobacteria bacterium]